MNRMISIGRFSEFCTEIITIFNEEKDESTLFDYYLHRVFDQTFDEFKSSLIRDDHHSEEDLITAINESRSMLDGFVPT